jgi:hypothetical protein
MTITSAACGFAQAHEHVARPGDARRFAAALTPETPIAAGGSGR